MKNLALSTGLNTIYWSGGKLVLEFIFWLLFDRGIMPYIYFSLLFIARSVYAYIIYEDFKWFYNILFTDLAYATSVYFK